MTVQLDIAHKRFLWGYSQNQKEEPMIDTNAKAMVMAAFMADALALGAHWIYDTQDIYKRFGRIENLMPPGPDSYHPAKEKGEFTHYGDQMFVLLESVAEKKNFHIRDFSDRWQRLFKHYRGYIDQATRDTLSGYASGKAIEIAGSSSNELAGASRIAPIVYIYADNLEKLIEAARQQTMMTHNNAEVIDSAEFFARVGRLILDGARPKTAIETVSRTWTGDPKITAWVQAGLESKDMDSVVAIARFGQSCHTPEAFPGVIHLVVRYENDLKEALIQAVMAGGDSAARGMMAGMLIGAYQGPESLPTDWLSGLRKRKEITALLDRI
jgi:ADP-ribosylglycohydrolase